MKKVTQIILGALLSLLVIIAGLYATGNKHLIRAFQLTYLKGEITANINDHRDFATRTIKAGDTQAWPLHANYNRVSINEDTLALLKRNKTAAFLIIKNGKIFHEQYFAPYHNRSNTNSFSMAKTVQTMLIGSAIEDGLIESFDMLIGQILPALKEKAEGVTLAHLSAMTSGMDWDEEYYSPFSPTPKLLYGYDAETFVLSRDYLVEPSSEYYYASSNTQLLAIALQHVLKEQTISEYLSAKYWQPLGMNDDGKWHTDAEGLELTFCCVSTNARNFAKIGQLLLQKGQWKGRQLLSEAFIERMIQPDLTNYYGHSIWIDYRDEPSFYALIGHLGQYIIVIPEQQIVVVRLGELEDSDLYEDAEDNALPFSSEASLYADQAIAMVTKIHAPQQ